MERKIYSKLLEWKSTRMQKPLMIIGARQIGKTYIIRKFCKNEFKNYVEINLQEEPSIVEIFKEKIDIKEKIERMQIALNKSIDFENTIIFFNEIQESEELISALKYFNESDVNYKIICAGSLLGVKLKRFSASFPVGKITMINMHPLDFEEFLMAEKRNDLIKEIKNCYDNNSKMSTPLHELLLDYYRKYLCVGGMPEAVQNFIDNDSKILNFDSLIIENIYESYLNDMTKYVADKSETVRIEEIYRSIPTQLGNNSNKFQYSNIKKNARSVNYESALNWLISSTMVYKCNLLTRAEIPPKGFLDYDTFKLYLNDVGILCKTLGVRYNDIILDNLKIYKGVIAENYVATQLIANGVDLIYWKSNNTAEVDFILYNDDGIIPIEVKAGERTQSKSLNVYIEKNNPKYAIRISTRNFGFENNIKSVPLYATFLIK